MTDPATDPRPPSGELERRNPFQAWGIPDEPDAYPASSGRGYPNQTYPPQPPPYADWPLVAGEPPPVRRRPLLMTAIVLALVVVLGGGGAAAYLLISGRNAGSPSPAAAVEGFLDAVYTKHSGKDAAAFVCPRARDESELDQVVFGVKTFEKDYPSPRTTWRYPEIHPNGQEASAQVTVSLVTANEQVAQKQITLLLVDDRGWWVCDVQPRSG